MTRLADPSWSPVYSDVFNQNIYFVLLNFSFQKGRDPNPRLDPVGGSKLEPGLLRQFQLSFQNICLCYSILDFLMSRNHFFSGNPINTYNFKRPLTFTFNKMHLQNDAFLQYQCNVKDTYTIKFLMSFFAYRFVIPHIAIEVDIHDRFTWGILPCLSFSSKVISHSIITVSHMAIEVDIHDRFT